MKFALPTIAVLVAIVASVVSFAGAEESSPTTKPTTKPAAVNKNCAVMSDHKADPNVTYLHKDKTYAFCCAGCIDDFKADPDKYAEKAK